MTWALSPDLTPGALAQWEGLWNDLLTGMPVVLLCQYNVERFSADFLRPELHTHPIVVYRGRIYPNCYFEDKGASRSAA